MHRATTFISVLLLQLLFVFNLPSARSCGGGSLTHVYDNTPYEDAPNQIWTLRDDGREGSSPEPVIYDVPESDFVLLESNPDKPLQLAEEDDGNKTLPRCRTAERTPHEKIHPLIHRWLADERVDKATLVDVIVSYKEEVMIPRFPIPEARDREAVEPSEEEYLAARMPVIERIQELRRCGWSDKLDVLTSLGARVKRQYWLINGARVLIPLGAIPRLAEYQRVKAIEPDKGAGILFAGNDAVDARAIMNSDSLKNFVFKGKNLNNIGRVGTIDTGVRLTHTMLKNQVTVANDCNDDCDNCNCGDGGKDQCGHGTRVAGAISGSADLGDNFAGSSAIKLHSYKIADDDSSCDLSHGATISAFERGVALGDITLSCSFAFWGWGSGSITDAANNAFLAGTMVFAANGNAGQVDHTESPANGEFVISVGGIRTSDNTFWTGNVPGEGEEDHIKPDILAPTLFVTATSGGDNSVGTFSGTSAATPIAAGAATLVRNLWRVALGKAPDPARVYSFVILFGSKSSVFGNTKGAGTLRLPVFPPTFNLLSSGKFSLKHKKTVTHTITVPEGLDEKFKVAAALWWPNEDDENDIDLRLIDPDGKLACSSLMSVGCWERCQVSNPKPGVWTAKIFGYNVDDPEVQRVFSALGIFKR